MRRRQSGFTLVELLISLSLAGLLIAGAFQIHSVFTTQSMKQKAVNDMQQSLRIAMQTIERSIRAGGVGMINGMMQSSLGCSGQSRNFFRVQYYNYNWWSTARPGPPPENLTPTPGGFDTSPGGVDNDPDILRVIAALDDAGTVNAKADDGTTATVMATSDLHSAFLHDDILLFNNTVYPGTATTAHGCMRQLSNDSTATSLGSLWQISMAHLPTYNGPANQQLCTNSSPSCTGVSYPAPVHHFRNQTIFRIQQANPANFQESPKLVVGTQPIGQWDPGLTWTVLADDIEDMQIALMMADGTVCNDRDDPTLATSPPASACDPSQATAVRITLVARTPMGTVGPTTTQGQIGGYEDEAPSVTATDNRLRRALTSIITLRN